MDTECSIFIVLRHGAERRAKVDLRTIQVESVPNAVRFAGTSVTRWYPSPGTDCSASLAIVGGPFFDLPCEVEYVIQSTPIDSIFAAEEEDEAEEVEDNPAP